jgi:uncharacterized SAM-binding protein YcdF (DUF218 family)
MKKRFLFIAVLFLFCMIIYFSLLHMKIREHSHLEATNHRDYLIILGARVKGTEPSLALQYRIDVAADYLKKNPDTIAIASGGQGSGEEISEAAAIKNSLLEAGIQGERILLEDKSTNTVENIKFSKKLLPANLDEGVLVTNDFHLYRAKSIAKDQGLKVEGLPAETPLIAVPKSYLREYLAISKYFLVKFINSY